MLGIVCDQRMPITLKVAVYKTIIRPGLMYGSETWVPRKAEQILLRDENVEMADGNKED